MTTGPIKEIERWVILISGFTQNIGRPTGFDKLWAKLRRAVKPEVVLTPPLVWNTDWKRWANFICRTSIDQPEIVVIGYSWGVGYGAVKLANELKKRGDNYQISHSVFCDPVYHSWMRPWRAFFNSSKIVLPRNINCEGLVWFRQHEGKPMGADLVSENFQSVPAPIILHCRHEYADDSATFHALAVKKVVDCNLACEVSGQAL